MSRQSGFELPPQSPDERDYRLMVLEAREDARELDTLDADRASDKWPAPTWQCEFCGRFYSERTAKDHAHCVQAEDRRNAEGMWPHG